MEYPQEPEVGVGAVVIEDGKILLVRRKYPPGVGKWSVPGGHLRLGESLYEAAKRELEEETGVKGEPIGVINVDELVEIDKEGKVRFHYVLIDVLLEPKTPLLNAKPSSDALEVLVVPVEGSLELDLTRTSRSLIEKLLRGDVKIIKSNYVKYASSNG